MHREGGLGSLAAGFLGHRLTVGLLYTLVCTVPDPTSMSDDLGTALYDWHYSVLLFVFPSAYWQSATNLVVVHRGQVDEVQQPPL